MARKMVVTDWVHVIAGCFVLGSLALGKWVHPGWFYFTALVGLMLLIFGLTGLCPMSCLLGRCGVPKE